MPPFGQVLEAHLASVRAKLLLNIGIQGSGTRM